MTGHADRLQDDEAFPDQQAIVRRLVAERSAARLGQPPGVDPVPSSTRDRLTAEWLLDRFEAPDRTSAVLYAGRTTTRVDLDGPTAELRLRCERLDGVIRTCEERAGLSVDTEAQYSVRVERLVATLPADHRASVGLRSPDEQLGIVAAHLGVDANVEWPTKTLVVQSTSESPVVALTYAEGWRTQELGLPGRVPGFRPELSDPIAQVYELRPPPGGTTTVDLSRAAPAAGTPSREVARRAVLEEHLVAGRFLVDRPPIDEQRLADGRVDLDRPPVERIVLREHSPLHRLGYQERLDAVTTHARLVDERPVRVSSNHCDQISLPGRSTTQQPQAPRVATPAPPVPKRP